MKSITILGTKISNINYQETLKKIDQFLNDSQQHYIVTPNPEIVLYAHKHPDYQQIINQANLAIADGVGLLLAARVKGKKIKKRVTGIDLIKKLFLLNNKKFKFFLLGGLPGVGELVKQKYNQVQIVAANNAGQIDQNGYGDQEQAVIDQINKSQANILLVAFGHPKQEYWIARNLSNLTSVKVAIAVGGALDYLSGQIKRAPDWMRQIGLEWLYRLIKQPRRFIRIINATIIFSLKVLFHKNSKLSPRGSPLGKDQRSKCN